MALPSWSLILILEISFRMRERVQIWHKGCDLKESTRLGFNRWMSVWCIMNSIGNVRSMIKNFKKFIMPTLFYVTHVD